MPDLIAQAHKVVLDRFRWQDGHADVWRLFDDGASLAAVVRGLAEPWRDHGLTKVAGVESRGFLLGAAVAVELGVGFVPIRKGEGLFPGPKLCTVSDADYRGRRHELRMQAVLGPDDVVLLVDDWAERGSQASAARELVMRAGATFAGCSLVVDQLEPSRRTELGRVTALVHAAELWAFRDSENSTQRALNRQQIPGSLSIQAAKYEWEHPRGPRNVCAT